MAGRSSTTVSAGKAQKIFTNNTGSPVVVAINAISADNTANPKCSIIVDKEDNYQLNYDVQTHTLSQSITWNTGDFDLMGSPIGSSSLGMYVGGDKQQMTFNGSSYNRSNAGMRYVVFDPYFFDNPSAYNKETAYGAIFPNSSNDTFFHTDLAADKSFFENWLQGSYSTGGTSYINSLGISYYDRAVIADPWTDVFMGVNSNGYMSGGYWYNYNGSSSVNRTTGDRSSDSFFYNRGVTSSGDWNSYYYNDGLTLNWQSDGGVFATGVNTNAGSSSGLNDNYSISLISGRQWRNNNTYTAGATNIKNAKDGATSPGSDDLINYNQNYHARLATNWGGGYSCSWIKYNPTTDRYYLNMQGGATADKGIWSFDHADVFTSGDSRTNFDNVCQKEVATHDLTQKTSQPQRIGASLWVCFTGNNKGDALYSSDLINWKTAAEYMNVANAVLVGSDNVANSARSMLVGSENSDKVFGSTTGFSSIPQGGLLENGVSIGTFERNGLILNNGDSLYLENQDSDTSIHSTVTFVEV